MKTKVWRSRTVVACAAVMLFASSAWADELTGLAKELATLRSDVETLSARLAENKASLQDELRTLARQKSELALENDREQIRLQKLRISIAEKQKVVETQKAESKVLLPAFDKVAMQVKRHIETSLPFRVEERLAELDKLRAQLAGGLLGPEQAIARLWSLIEDEHRLTRENGLYRQTVTVDGSEQLVDVARIGMVMLYFRTSDGRVGAAYRDGAEWTYRTIAGEEEVKLVNTLFESFKKQIRVGYFELPGVLGAAR